jgi:hypothetical protein
MKVRKYSKHVGGEDNLTVVLHDMYKALRGRISYGGLTQNGLQTDNIDGAYGTTSNSGAANTEFVVTHNLNRVPVGFHVIRQNGAGSFYDSGTTWTATQIFLKCSAANLSATFFIF